VGVALAVAAGVTIKLHKGTALGTRVRPQDQATAMRKVAKQMGKVETEDVLESGFTGP